MKYQLVIPAFVGIALMLSLSLIPAYAYSYEKSVFVIFKDVNDRAIRNAECNVTANDFVYYTLTNSYGFATVFLPDSTLTASVECSYGDSSENICDIFLKRSTTKVVLNHNPYDISEPCN